MCRCRWPRFGGVPGSTAEVFDGLVEVVGHCVYVGVVAGSAHGHVGEVPSAAVVVEVGGVEGGSLAAVNRRRVRVGELIRAHLFWSKRCGPARRPSERRDTSGALRARLTDSRVACD